MANINDLDGLVKQLDKEYEDQGYMSEAMLDAYVKYATYAIFQLDEYKYGRELAKSATDKVTETVKKANFTDIWELERKTWGMRTYLLDGFYNLCLLRSFWDFECFIFYMERDRVQ